MTSSGAGISTGTALTGGASDYLAKPLQLHTLLQAVDVQLETRHTVF